MIAEEEAEEKPKPPSIGPMVAVLLEVAIFGDVATHRSVFGLLCCVAYFYFSATRWALFGK